MKTDYSFSGQSAIPTPQLIYYPEIIRENIRKMIRISGSAERLWPHIKTHKMAEVTRMLMAAGIDKFKCATIAEAEMVAGVGAAQAVVAYPLIGPNRKRFLKLVETYPVTVFYAIGDDTEQIRLLGNEAAEAGLTVNVLMDVDTGQHRTGVRMEQVVERFHEWQSLPGIRMRGMHCYDGQRHETRAEERDEATATLDAQLKALKEQLNGCDIMIMGGTPSFPYHVKHTDFYVSPGTCVIQDQGYGDSYQDMDFVPGAAVMVRVVSRPSEDTFTMDLGTKAVATDPSPERAVIAGMPYLTTVIQNEEHWVVRVPAEHIKDIPRIGTELFAIPVHVCPTTALYPYAVAVENGQILGNWEVTARNRKITI